MQTQELTRRTLLMGAGAMISGAALSSLQVAQAADTGPAPPGARPAGAAGTITIGKDLTVNRLGFGAMRITGEGIWGDPADVVEARRVLQRAVELGVNFIDTADSYGPEVSERLIAEALHPYPSGLVIATKGGIVRPAREQWERDGRPQHLREACQASLKRLRL
jgi:aryl-alcohol dehydrogenase-like predicted oxidoreductase